METGIFEQIALYAQLGFVALSLLLFLFARLSYEQSGNLDGANPVQAAYVLYGELTCGDLVALLPYWAKAGILRMQLTQSGGMALHRLGNLPNDASAAEGKLFALLFQNGPEHTLGVPSREMEKQLHAAKIAQLQANDSASAQVFTKASRRASFWISLFLFLCVSLAVFVFATAVIANPNPGEIWGSALMGVGAACALTLPKSRLLRRFRLWTYQSGPVRIGLVLGFCALIAAYAVLLTLAGNLLPQLQILMFISAAAFALLAILQLFAHKRTDIGAIRMEERQSTDILREQVNACSPDANYAEALYGFLKGLKKIWDDTEKLKMTDNHLAYWS